MSNQPLNFNSPYADKSLERQAPPTSPYHNMTVKSAYSNAVKEIAPSRAAELAFRNEADRITTFKDGPYTLWYSYIEKLRSFSTPLANAPSACLNEGTVVHTALIRMEENSNNTNSIKEFLINTTADPPDSIALLYERGRPYFDDAAKARTARAWIQSAHPRTRRGTFLEYRQAFALRARISGLTPKDLAEYFIAGMHAYETARFLLNQPSTYYINNDDDAWERTSARAEEASLDIMSFYEKLPYEPFGRTTDRAERSERTTPYCTMCQNKRTRSNPHATQSCPFAAAIEKAVATAPLKE